MNDKEKQSQENQRQLGQSFVTWGNAGILSFHMVTGPLLGVFLGYYADQWLDSRPICVVIGLVMGIIAGALNIFRDLRRILREQDASDKRDRLRRIAHGLPPVPSPPVLTAEEHEAEDDGPVANLPGYGQAPAWDDLPDAPQKKGKKS